MSLAAWTGALFWGALGVATAAAVILHFLRVRPRRVVVPTLLFWRQAPARRAPRMLFERLARWGTLALVLAILWSMILAAGRPAWGEPGCQVVLLDPAGLGPAAREEAAARLTGLAARPGRLAVVVASRPLRPLWGFADEPAGAGRAVRTASPGETLVPASWVEALAAAGELLHGAAGASVRILAVNPGTVPGDAALLAGTPVVVEALPAPIWDDGVAAAGPVPAPDGTWSVLVEAARQGKGGPTRRLVVVEGASEVAGQVLGDETGPARVLLAGLAPGTSLTARLEGGIDPEPRNDGLALAVPRVPAVRVFLADPDPDPALAAAVAASQWAVRVAGPEPGAVAVAATREGAERARGLPALLFQGNGPAAAPVRPAADHPLVAGLSFTGVRGPLAGLPGPGRVLLAAGDQPVAHLEEGAVRVGLDPADVEGGLAESEDFPRFVARAVKALAGSIDPDGAWRRGEWSTLSTGFGPGPLAVRSGGREAAVPLRDGVGEWLPAGAGPAALGGALPLAVPGGGPPLAGSPGENGPGGGGEGGLPLEVYLALTALILLSGEWWAYHRGRVA